MPTSHPSGTWIELFTRHKFSSGQELKKVYMSIALLTFLYSASGKRREKVHHKIKIRMKVFIKRLANHKHYKNDYYQKSEMLI